MYVLSVSFNRCYSNGRNKNGLSILIVFSNHIRQYHSIWSICLWTAAQSDKMFDK